MSIFTYEFVVKERKVTPTGKKKNAGIKNDISQYKPYFKPNYAKHDKNKKITLRGF